MRKIKRFKISTRQKEILRKIQRLGIDLTAAGLTDEIALTRFIVQLAEQLDPGTVYELNENVLWDVGNQAISAQGMFSACAVTLGKTCTQYTDSLQGPEQLAAQTVLFEFLRTAVLFVLDLVKEQANKEEYDVLEPQFVYIPKLGLAPEPKLFKESAKTDASTAQKIIPEILKHIHSEKIEVSYDQGQLTPLATTLFIVPRQKKKRKGKK